MTISVTRHDDLKILTRERGMMNDVNKQATDVTDFAINNRSPVSPKTPLDAADRGLSDGTGLSHGDVHTCDLSI